jgi:hypothetical protein
MIRIIDPKSYLPQGFQPEPATLPRMYWDPKYGDRVFYDHKLYVVIDTIEYQNGRSLHLVRAGRFHFGLFARIRRVRAYDFHKLTLTD